MQTKIWIVFGEVFILQMNKENIYNVIAEFQTRCVPLDFHEGAVFGGSTVNLIQAELNSH